jgi:hypothetical protein
MIMSHISIPIQNVTIVVISDKDATVARAAMDNITATASAKREPGDKPDAVIGADLATARALARLAAKLERRARGRIRNADAIKTHRRERAEAARNTAGFSGLRAGPATRRGPRGGQIELVPVSELFVRCSYPQRPDVKTASDTCRQHADSAVQDDEGFLWYRCPDHEGQLAPGIPGRVVTSVPREKKAGGRSRTPR